MSLKLNERYPGRMNNPSADYPQGSFKNRTAPSAKDGSYLEQDWANDKEGFFQSLLSKAGVLANGLIDKVGASQYFDALIQTRQAQTGVAFTSAGVSPALTLTPSPAITAYSANQRFRVKFAAASTGSDTLNISGLGAKNVKQYSSAGTKVAAVFAASQLSDVEYDGVDFVLLDQLPSLPQATEAVLGGGKISTQAMTNAGTDDASIVTPKKLRFGFSALLAANGYLILPTWLGGLILQWGTTTGSGTGSAQVFTFPVPFPNNCFSAHPGIVSNPGGSVEYVQFVSTSLLGVTAATYSNVSGPTIGTLTFSWIAVGN